MNCGTDCCQVEIILHSLSAGLRMLVTLNVQLHAEDGKEDP